MEDAELYRDAIEGIRKNVSEAIEVLNNGYWGPVGGRDHEDAVKCRAILRRIVPCDWHTGKELPTDLLNMQARASQP